MASRKDVLKNVEKLLRKFDKAKDEEPREMMEQLSQIPADLGMLMEKRRHQSLPKAWPGVIG